MKISTLTNLDKFQLSAKVLLSILAVSLCFGNSDRASAAPVCANVNVNIQNGTPDTIKLTNLEYFDFAQKTFVPKNLAQVQLTSGTVERVTRNLAEVGNVHTKLRVTYQHKQGPNSFAAPVRVTTDRFVCIDGSTHPVLLDK
jgi:hypothetical protein